MLKKKLQPIIRRGTIFLILMVILEFTNLGSVLLPTFQIPETHASGNSRIFITTTASTTWVVPNDWTNASNTIEVIGGAGGGAGGGTGGSSLAGGSGGGGGAGGTYAKISNKTLSGTVNINIGTGGSGAAGGDTWLSSTTSACATADICGKGGGKSTGSTGGATSTGSVAPGGSIVFGGKGGAGAATSTSNVGSGGGGAGGSGLTSTGVNGSIGVAGQTSGNGGNGGAGNNGGAGSGSGGTGCTNTTCAASGNGGSGTEWQSSPTTYGSGGGGGGGQGGASGATGGSGGTSGSYGAGGSGGGGGGKNKAGGSGSSGIQGIIVITYTPAAPGGAPGTPTYASISTSTLTVNWTTAAGSTQYDLQRSTDGSSFSHIATTTAATYADTSLSPSTIYYYKVAGEDSTSDTGPFSASSSVTTTAAPPSVTSFANNTRALTDGGKSGDSITITGTSFGAPLAGSRANCSGAAGTGCIQFNSIGGVATTTVADGDVSAWTATSITFTVSTTLASLGGAGALQVFAANTGSNTSTFYVYPTITSMATCASCNANAAREYNAADTDGLIMLSGNHFGSTAGTVWFNGGFGSVSGVVHGTTEGACTTNGWSGSTGTGDTVCAEVSSGISDSVYTGAATIVRNDASSTLGGWTTTTALPTALDSGAAVASNGYMYHIAGNLTGGVTTSTVFYAPINATGSLGAWQTTAALPAAVFEPPAVSNNNYLYLLGGIDSVTVTSTVLFTSSTANGTLNPWQRTTSMPTARSGFHPVINNGYIYVTGGNPSTTAVIYAPITATGSIGAWQNTATLPGGIDYMPVLTYNNYFYSVGGWVVDAGAETSTVYYTSSTATGALNTWKTTTALTNTSIIGEYSGVMNNGYIYTMGQSTATAMFSAINSDGTLGSWQTATALPTSTQDGLVVVNNGYIYSIAGRDAGGNYIGTVYLSAVGKNDPISLRVLPRIVSTNPTTALRGSVVQLVGDHFCQSGACITVTSSMAASSDNVKFGNATATATDFVSQTGGAGACNGSGNPWINTEICLQVPNLSIFGSTPITVLSNTSYSSNAQPFGTTGRRFVGGGLTR